MATYKVIQDIEADEKFLGPLTLKQFIFAAITVISLYLSYFFLTKNLGFLVLFLLPIIIVCGFLAFPWGRDQPTEIWLLAKLRFFFKPRLRVWDQSGMEELVTITVPKKVEENLTDNLSQSEVRSRLRALADTIDSRGWAVKGAEINSFARPGFGPQIVSSDRLVEMSDMSAPLPKIDINAEDDILDAQNNPLARQLNQMITASGQAHRQETLAHMQQVREGKAPAPSAQGGEPAPNYWFMDQPEAPDNQKPGYSTFSTKNAGQFDSRGQPIIGVEEQALLEKIHREQAKGRPASYGHMRVIEPLSSKKHTKKNGKKHAGKATKEPPTQHVQPADSGAPSAPAPQAQAPMTPAPDPAILGLVNNDDLTVATIARQAKKDRKEEPPQDEVVISLR